MEATSLRFEVHLHQQHVVVVVVAVVVMHLLAVAVAHAVLFSRRNKQRKEVSLHRDENERKVD